MKKFFKAVGIGAAICTGIGAAAAVTKKIMDKNNASSEDVVEEPEFEDGESDAGSESTTETTDSTETN